MFERWNDWRRARKMQRQRRRDVMALAPVMHRCGLSPEITVAYFAGNITFEQWREEANKASRHMQEVIDTAVRHGADGEVLDGYVHGTHSRAEMMAELEKSIKEGITSVFHSLGHEPPEIIMGRPEQDTEKS